MAVPTKYARSGDLQIAYQTRGEEPLDVLFVPAFMSNIDIMWEHPGWARLLGRLTKFSRLIMFDRRGNGMSDGSASAPLEDQIDDVLAVMDAAGCEQPALLSMNEGCPLAIMFAASHPQLVRALVLLTPLSRLVAGPGYEWAQTVEERAELIRAVREHWGSSSQQNPWSIFGGETEEQREGLARFQRLAMSPGQAAAALEMIGRIDVRDVLASIQCPTLVMRGEHDDYLDARHSRYVAEHVPGARYTEIPGVSQVWTGDGHAAADEMEQFLTGTRRRTVSDRVLATVLFTDIVGSTERAARLGDGPWRALLSDHDAIVRREVEQGRGRLVKSLGDGGLAVFDGPSRAIGSALAIRDALRMLDVDIRAGVHTGECELLAGDDIGGLAVHIGARVSALAGAGEVLVSSTVRDLIVGSGITLVERGEHELKGVPGEWRLFAVQG
jgi:class 3 adenylate cyclase